MNRLQTAFLILFSASFVAIAQEPGTVTVPIHRPAHGEKKPASTPLDEAALRAQPEEQREGQLDASQTIFTVLAAINAAGFDTGAASPAEYPPRASIRDRLAAVDAPSLRDLKAFYAAHRKSDPIANLSQYISFGLAINGPPDFTDRFDLSRLPPDVAALAGFGAILPRFYQEANIAALWQKAQPAFDQVISLYHSPLSRAILEANAYMRNATGGLLGRKFQVYVDLLGAPGETQSRSYQYDTYVVVTPARGSSPERTEELMSRQVMEVRHAYLHYLLDPLSNRYGPKVQEKEELGELAQPAPALAPVYKSDFWALTDESLIKAVEARLAAGGEAKRAEMVDEAMREGFVLAPAFYEALAKYETQEQAMRLYYPDLVGAINIKAERKRLANVQFATTRTSHGPEIASAREPEMSASDKLLSEAEELSNRRQLEPAREAFLKVLEQPPTPSLHARAYYGLARIAVLQNHPDTAVKLFEHSLELSPDAQTRSWAGYYLGRLFDAEGETEQARKYYNSVLETPGASPKAQEQARKALAGDPDRKAVNP